MLRPCEHGLEAWPVMARWKPREAGRTGIVVRVGDLRSRDPMLVLCGLSESEAAVPNR